jgi:hypothetical protein
VCKINRRGTEAQSVDFEVLRASVPLRLIAINFAPLLSGKKRPPREYPGDLTFYYSLSKLFRAHPIVFGIVLQFHQT